MPRQKKTLLVLTFILVGCLILGVFKVQSFYTNHVLHGFTIKKKNKVLLIPQCLGSKEKYVNINIQLTEQQTAQQWLELIVNHDVVALGVVDPDNQRVIKSILPKRLCGQALEVVKFLSRQTINEKVTQVLIQQDVPRGDPIDASMGFAQLKREGLLAAYKQDFSRFEVFLDQYRVVKKPEGFWGILSDMAEIYGPLGAVFIYEHIQDNPQDLAYLNLLNGTWNQRKVSKVYALSQGREKIYAMAKLGIMGKIWPLFKDVQELEKQSQGLALADVYWAMGKINSPLLHKAYINKLITYMESLKNEERKQFFHALSNFKSMQARDFTKQCLKNQACLKNRPPILDNLYATVGRLHLKSDQAWLIEHLEKNKNEYIKNIIVNFVGSPMQAVSRQYIIEKLHDPDYPDYLKYSLLKNIRYALTQDDIQSIKNANANNVFMQMLLKEFFLV